MFIYSVCIKKRRGECNVHVVLAVLIYAKCTCVYMCVYVCMYMCVCTLRRPYTYTCAMCMVSVAYTRTHASSPVCIYTCKMPTQVSRAWSWGAHVPAMQGASGLIGTDNTPFQYENMQTWRTDISDKHVVHTLCTRFKSFLTKHEVVIVCVVSTWYICFSYCYSCHDLF